MTKTIKITKQEKVELDVKDYRLDIEKYFMMNSAVQPKYKIGDAVYTSKWNNGTKDFVGVIFGITWDKVHITYIYDIFFSSIYPLVNAKTNDYKDFIRCEKTKEKDILGLV